MPDDRQEHAVAAFRDGRHDVAMELFRDLAADGSGLGEYYVGRMYLEGLGVQQNEQEALTWLRRAAESNCREAQYMLSPAFGYEAPNRPSESDSVGWLVRCAERGHAEGQYLLAVHLATGKDMPQRNDEALKWYLRAAGNGHAEAEYNAGVMYLLGEGAEKNEAKAGEPGSDGRSRKRTDRRRPPPSAAGGD